jgi:general nucleoside transport system permease protein
MGRSAMRLEARNSVSRVWLVAAPFAAVAFTLIAAALFVAWAGAPVGRTYSLIFEGGFGSRFAWSETLTRATPLILTGLAAAIAFRAHFYNIGAEGQLYGGALAAVAVGGMSGPPELLFPSMMLAAMIAGALLLVVPALLRTKLGVDEVVTTLLLNFIVLLFVSMMLEGPLKDPMGMGWPQSAPVLPEAELPKLVERSRLHWGLVLAIAASVVLWVMNTRTVWGYEIKAVGANPRAAGFAGIAVNGVMLRVAVLSGGLAGLAGAAEIAGLRGYLTLDLSPGFGYSGIVVAMLAQLHPLAVVVASVFVAGIFVGADAMSRSVPVPNYIADVLVAVSLLCILVAGFLVRYRVRWSGVRAG